MTFGVLISNADDFAQSQMWRGINDYAQKQGIHLIAYMCSYQSSSEDLALHVNTVFDSIYNSKTLDGVIFFSGYISHMMGGAEVLSEYIKRVPAHIPCISISEVIENVPSILADNIGGIYTAVSHLIKVHNKRRIAFIRGPEAHQEADERLLGYKKALEDNGLEFDPEYVLPGDFSHDGATRAVKILLEERNIVFDALAASDDISALQAIREFSNRGIQTPGDIAVTGFDNNRDAATFVPSLSTSGQDFYAMGQAATQALLTKINGGDIAAVSYVPTIFIRRQSCGCFTRDFDTAQFDTSEAEATSLAPFILEALLPLFPQDVSLTRWQNWIIALTHMLSEKPFRKSDFLQSMDKILIDFSHRSKQYALWTDVLNTFMYAAQRFPDEVDDATMVLETLLYATTLVNDIITNESLIQESLRNDTRLTLRRVASALVLTFDVDVLADELPTLLPQMGIRTALVALYPRPIKSDDDETARNPDVIFGFDSTHFDSTQRFHVKSTGDAPLHISDFPSIEGFNYEASRRSLFFMPLFFKDEELGAAIITYDAGITAHAYETMRINLSTAIKGAGLLNKINRLSITDELTGLYNRRGFFQNVYTRMEFMRRNPALIPVVMFMDLDGLKMINDNYGHKAGDLILADFADILKECLRKEDIIGRIGGDEFVVFSSVREGECGGQMNRRIRAKMEQYNARSKKPYLLACSIGSVVLEEVSKECFEDAMLSADKVLYEEKTKKRKLGIARPL